jgi:SAM-dependent methyltransferase
MSFDWRSLLRRPRPVGVVDTRGPRVQGWAYDKAARQPLVLEILVDGTTVGTTTADRYRADLTSQCPDGRCAFEFTVPAHLRDGSERDIEVRELGAKRPLFGGRFKTRLIAEDHYLDQLRTMLRDGAWSAFARRDGAVAHIKGWYIAPPGAEGARITANGHALDLTIEDGNGGWRTPLPVGLSVCQFSATAPADDGTDTLVLSFGEQHAFRPLQDLTLPLFDVPLPNAEHRKRVDGHGDIAGFNLGGYSNALKLDAVARRFGGAPLAALGPVLDWGCGCGRVARFVARAGADLTGIDIDAENARWCAEHIRGKFIGVATEPPTPFADNTFAAIYGLSVFTHLDRPHETLWLEELHRIAKPGALLMLSVHGGLIAAYSGMLEHVFSPEFTDGFVDLGRNPDIDAVTGGSTYYRNVFHRPDYIAAVWSRYFEIVSIENGIIDNMQDLVVARKR